MPISLSAVDHVAELAKLDLSTAERSLFADQLSRILAHIDQLAALTSLSLESGAEATPAGPSASVLRLRPDVTEPSLTRAEALANAPLVEAGSFRVPPVLE